MLNLPDAIIDSSNITADLADYKTRIHDLCTSTEQRDKITDFIQKQALFMKDCLSILPAQQMTTYLQSANNFAVTISTSGNGDSNSQVKHIGD